MFWRQQSNGDETASDKGSTNASETGERKNSDADNEDSNANEEASEQQQQAAGQQPQKQIKRKTRAIDLPLNARVPQLTKNEINILVEHEVCFRIQLLTIRVDVI